MPEFTLTGYENRIKAYATEHSITINKGKVKTLAFSLCKRQARMTDLDLERILTHSDPTPKQALRNIEQHERWDDGTSAVRNIERQRKAS